jgi:ATP-dependent DNA ligase
MRGRAERQWGRAAGEAEDAAQTGPEDGVMLPQLLPMLAVSAEPFDSPEYCFECKWDGIRALATVEAAGWRLWGRERADYTARYLELDVLGGLPAETLLDGELVACDANGRPDLLRLLRRHSLTNPWRIRQTRHWCSVRYVVFDLLYHAGRCLIREPLVRRREVLAEVCQRLDVAEVRFSEGVVGAGKALYAAVVAQGHEGVMAKHLASPYRPGRRSAA